MAHRYNMEPPTHTLTWQISRSEGIDGLDLVDRPIPQLGKKDVLVKIHAASLNFRDALILNGHYPLEIIPKVTPLSDGAGEVISVGSEVISFKKNDKVVTAMNGDFASGPIKPEIFTRVLGSSVHGVAAEYVVLPENFLLPLPHNLSFIEGSTLPTAGLTAWNTLYGAQGRPLKPGGWVLAQGTGGVSTFAILFAKAAGANVVAVTSSAAKAEVLKQLGADHVVNYSEVRDWGSAVKSLTPGNAGVDIAIDIGGGESIIQSFAALKMDGLVALVGFRSDDFSRSNQHNR
ncbi:hypothetical protein CDV31_005672 [Fusarium ambrosium]|uniref:Enoyl reductase (ER) domain-containing protein n=1 Tax=Fusarium ambrosium TaxID=131363 RepID=A0A428UHT0_9HYPO|nr:hypothetical protein CDV31_005672 [Fusarium ambrosium]